MEFLLAGGVVAVLAAVVGFVLPSWWWLAAPPALFAGVVAVAWETGNLDGEGGLAMAIVLLMTVPLMLFAMGGLAIAVAVGKSRRGQDEPAPPSLPGMERPEGP